jgi:hypothetical protein
MIRFDGAQPETGGAELTDDERPTLAAWSAQAE